MIKQPNLPLFSKLLSLDPAGKVIWNKANDSVQSKAPLLSYSLKDIQQTHPYRPVFKACV